MGFTFVYIFGLILYSLPCSLCPIYHGLSISKITGPLYVLISLSRKVVLHPYTPAHSTGPHIIYWVNSHSASALSWNITCCKKSCLIFPLLYQIYLDQFGFFFCNKFLEPRSFPSEKLSHLVSTCPSCDHLFIAYPSHFSVSTTRAGSMSAFTHQGFPRMWYGAGTLNTFNKRLNQ